MERVKEKRDADQNALGQIARSVGLSSEQLTALIVKIAEQRRRELLHDSDDS